jgi:hypothetical protein
MRLAESDFPGLLRAFGANVRRRRSLNSIATLSADDEFALVTNGINECVSIARKISDEDKQVLIESLKEIIKVGEKTFDHDEGTLLYRRVRDNWRRLVVFHGGRQHYFGNVGIELRKYSDKISPSSMTYFVATIAHCSDEFIPSFCKLCPMIALPKIGYCNTHNPSTPGKKGYERGQRVWDLIVSNQALGKNERYPNYQRWRSNCRALFEEPRVTYIWRAFFLKELREKLGNNWRKEVTKVFPDFGNRPLSKALEAVRTLDKLDTHATSHPKYCARKFLELLAFIKVDQSIPRRKTFTFSKLQEVLDAHDGSTKLAAAALKVSQRRVQILLKKNSSAAVPIPFVIGSP